MSTVRTWLDAQDGALFAAGILGGFVLVCLFCALVNALARVDRPQRPRRESMSERHDRLDREAAAACASRVNVPAFERLGRSANR